MTQISRTAWGITVGCLFMLSVVCPVAGAQDAGETVKPAAPIYNLTEEGTSEKTEGTDSEAPPFPEPVGPDRPRQTVEQERSVIEELFSGRIPPADVPLTQFGYSFFRPLEETLLYSLPVSAEYVLGPGDQLVMYVWGDVFQMFETEFEPVFNLSVDRDGKVFVPRIGVFHVWGATVGEVEGIVQRALDAKVKGAHVRVTVGNLRVFPVFLVGEVNRPGRVMVNGLCTVIDALSLGRGVKKTGRLRNVSLKRRAKDRIDEIKTDLYDLFVMGTPQLISLREGDVITVSPIGVAVGVSGNVKRPAIYELRDEKTAEEILELAGTVLPSGNLQRIQVERFHENRKKVVLDVPLGESVLRKFELFDGDLLKVYPIYEEPENVVYLEGNVKHPGIYQYRSGMRLSELIHSAEDLLPETYLRYAEIVRRKGLDKEPVTIPFSMEEFLHHRINPELEPLDRVKILSRFSYPRIEIGGEVEGPGSYPFWEGITLRDLLGTAVLKGDPQTLKVEIRRKEEPKDREEEEKEEKEKEEKEKEEAAIEEDAPIRVIYLYDLLVSGEETVNLPLEPGMKLVVKPVEAGEQVKSVTVLGRVNHPGVYPITPGCMSSGPIGQIREKISLYYGTGLGHCLYCADCTASFVPGSIVSCLVVALG